MVERHVRAFPNPGGTFLPWLPGFEFMPCTESSDTRTTWFRYDQAGRLIERSDDEFTPGALEGGPHGGLIDPGTDHDGTPDSGIRYIYESERLVSVEYWWTDGRRIRDPGKQFQFTYDTSGQLNRVTRDYGDLGVTVFELNYDAAGRLQTIVEFDTEPSVERGTSRFEYDEDDRLVLRRWTDRSGTRQDHVFVYGADGNLQSVQIEHANSERTFSKTEVPLRYDRSGRFERFGKDGRTLTYDAQGRPAGWKGKRRRAENSVYEYSGCRE